MVGCFGNSKEDRYNSQLLDKYLDSLDNGFSGRIDEYYILFENDNLECYIEVVCKNIEVLQNEINSYDIEMIKLTTYDVGSKIVKLSYDELVQIFNIDNDMLMDKLMDEIDEVVSYA